MQLENVYLDAYTFICILIVGALRTCCEVHNEILCQVLSEGHYDIGTMLVDMYFSCGSATKAQNVFDSF